MIAVDRVCPFLLHLLHLGGQECLHGGSLRAACPQGEGAGHQGDNLKTGKGWNKFSTHLGKDFWKRHTKNSFIREKKSRYLWNLNWNSYIIRCCNTTKHCEIAKGCPEYIASVVDVSSCSNQKTSCQKLILFRNYVLYSALSEFQSSVLGKLKFLIFVTK